MNVGSPDSQLNVATGASPVARESNAPSTTESATAAALFLDLLGQATAVANPVAAVVAKTLAPGEATDDTTDDDAALNWAMPFLAPVPAVGVTDRSAATTGDVQPLQELTARVDAAPQALVPGVAKIVTDPLQVEGLLTQDQPEAANLAASVTPPRVEAASSGGAHAIVRQIPVPVTDARWGEHVGHEVRILVERGIQGATLRLTPEHLGPVDVRIDIVNDKANVVFGATQADTRAALTDAIPKLREMFASAGLTLGDAGVRQEQPGSFHGAAPRHTGAGLPTDEARDDVVTSGRTVRIGLVDAYA